MNNNLQIECDDCHRDDVRNTIGNLFANGNTELPTASVEKCVTEVMFGTRKTRFGPTPDNEQRAFMETLVGRYASIGAPIQMLTMWGSVKAYGLCDDRCGMDVWDAMAINRLIGISNDIKRIYSPGTQVTIIAEDVTEVVLGSCGDRLPRLIENYADALAAYAEAHSDSVRFIKESELLHRVGSSVDGFLAEGERLTEYLTSYWEASNDKDESTWESLPEFKALNSVGWKGLIPTVMREHYLHRVGAEYPNMENSQRARMVCRYFGNALARYRLGMMNTNVHDSAGELAPVKTGFGTLGPGVSQAMLRGRVDYKVKTSKGNTSVPPWCGWGMLTKLGTSLEPTILGVRHGSPVGSKVRVTSNGVCFRADVLAAAA